MADLRVTLGPERGAAASSIVPIALSQEMLAHMVGTTRSRINQFMNKFRKMRYIDYGNKITVYRSLMNLIRDTGPSAIFEDGLHE